jgi:hypothetical protein
VTSGPEKRIDRKEERILKVTKKSGKEKKIAAKRRK